MADAIVRVVENRAVVTGGGPELLSVLFARLAQIKAELLSAIATGDTGLAGELQANIDQLETDVSGKQPSALNLTALSGLSFLSNNLIYINNSGQLALAPLTSFGRSLVDDADATAGRSTLGLTRADQASAEAGTSTALSMTPQAATWHFNARVPSYWRTTLLPLTTTAAVREALSVPSIADLTGEATTRAGADTAIHGALDPIAAVVKTSSVDGGADIVNADGFVLAEFDERGLGIGGVRMEYTADAAIEIVSEGFSQAFADPSVEGSSDAAGGNAIRLWAGALTDTGFTVAADVEAEDDALCRLVVSKDAGFLDRTFISDAVTPTETQKSDTGVWRSVKIDAKGLRPDTAYWYRIEINGQPSTSQVVQTAPREGLAAPFRFAFGSCSDLSISTTVPALEAMAAEDPLFFIHLGDIVYSDIGVDDVRLQRASNSRAYRNSPSAALANASVPVAYMPDDHDFGGNDTHWDRVYTSGATHENIGLNTRAAYRETVPHYPLVQSMLGETDPERTLMTQEFTVGKTRFLMPDCMSQRRYSVGVHTMLGHTSGHEYWDQLAWFQDALLRAGTDGCNRVFFITTTPWNGGGGWQSHWANEQVVIANFIRDNPSIPPLTILTGDRHRPAIDDGTLSDVATGGGLNVTQILSSPLLRADAPFTETMGHTWLGEPAEFTDKRQSYVVVDVEPDGNWTAKIVAEPYTDGAGTVLGSYSTSDL